MESGAGGLSALLIEANAPGVTARRMHTGGAVQSSMSPIRRGI